MRLLILVFLAVAFAALPAGAQKFEVHVMPVESMDGLIQWLQQKPAPTGVYPRAQELKVGKKIYMPIFVNGLDPSAHGPLELVGDIEVLGPDGKSLLTQKKCCRYSVPDRSGLRFAMLSYVFDLTMDATDPKGVYTLRSSVTDGKQTVTGTDQIRFGAPAKSPAAEKPAESTKPAMRADAPSYSHGDRRNCLDLPTQSEIIRCTEGK